MSDDKSQWPQWLKDANTKGACVKIVDGTVVWMDGEFRDGEFRGGEFMGGKFMGGYFRGGEFMGGEFMGGYFMGGEFRGGEFMGGYFMGGEFRGGEFRGGEFRGGEFMGGKFMGGEWNIKTIDRISFMASMAGVHPNSNGKYVGYRSTNLDCTGRYTESFKQVEGKYYEKQIPDSGGTCQRGIHVASMATALTYFGVRPSQLWRVTFEPKDLLDADGQKCRIRGGFFEKIDWPFYKPEA